jgi:DNA repair protein RadA/Sms
MVPMSNVLPFSSSYQCLKCGVVLASYSPTCGECGAENTLRSRAAVARFPVKPLSSPRPEPLRVQNAPIPRTLTGLGALDSALGGGFVPGSATLLSGERGVGKSTLALRLAAAIPNTLYVASEETKEQVEYRMTRTALDAAGVPVLVTRDEEEILQWAGDYSLLLVDSVHRLHDPTRSSESLIDYVKGTGKSLVCVAHLTKDGTVRGPSTMSYLYDVEIELIRVNESERELAYDPRHGMKDGHARALETLKNRWGPEGSWPLWLTAKGWTEEKS